MITDPHHVTYRTAEDQKEEYIPLLFPTMKFAVVWQDHYVLPSHYKHLVVWLWYTDM